MVIGIIIGIIIGVIAGTVIGIMYRKNVSERKIGSA